MKFRKRQLKKKKNNSKINAANQITPTTKKRKTNFQEKRMSSKDKAQKVIPDSIATSTTTTTTNVRSTVSKTSTVTSGITTHASTSSTVVTTNNSTITSLTNTNAPASVSDSSAASLAASWAAAAAITAASKAAAAVVGAVAGNHWTPSKKSTSSSNNSSSNSQNNSMMATGSTSTATEASTITTITTTATATSTTTVTTPENGLIKVKREKGHHGAVAVIPEVGKLTKTSVELLRSPTTVAFPSILHEGKHIVVGDVGAEFKIRVSLAEAERGFCHLIKVKIDEKPLGYVGGLGESGMVAIFHGFKDSQNFSKLRAFKFSSVVQSTSNQDDESGNLTSVGRITIWIYRTSWEKSKNKNAKVPECQQDREKPVTRPASKKFWKTGALVTTAGSVVKKNPSEVNLINWGPKRKAKQLVDTVELFYDLPENLELRGVVLPPGLAPSRDDDEEHNQSRSITPAQRERIEALRRNRIIHESCDLTNDDEELWVIRKRLRQKPSEDKGSIAIDE